jgi:hypothetical protein
MGGKPRIDDPACTGRETSPTSELQKLSTDPTITRHPDPNLNVRFRDPDELGEEEPVQFVVNSAAPPRRAHPAQPYGKLRRSPKE